MKDKPILDLATWNIHMGIGADGERNLERTAEVIRGMRPDLLGLQEVDNRMGAKGDDLVGLRELTGMDVIGGPTFLKPGGDYGNALLTRLAVLKIERHDISVWGREPRGILVVTVDWRGESLRIAVTHLGLMPGERRFQARRLIEYLSGMNSSLILMGDFNEWLIWGRPLRWLRRHFGKMGGPATFPARWPVLRLDHILADPPDRLFNQNTYRTPLSISASDHLPLMAKFCKP